MYSIGFGLGGHGEARSSITGELNHRPYFHGLPPRLFNEEEARERIAKLATEEHHETAVKLRHRYDELKASSRSKR